MSTLFGDTPRESEYNSCLRYVFAAVCFQFMTMPANLLEFPHVYAQFRQASPLRAEAALATPQRRKYFMEPGRQVVEHFGPDLVSPCRTRGTGRT